ncbi:MAG: helix-turn-helix transcriptional regulator [Candidatus Omnitrophota bacterium]|nr:helix-turn-helix transcriptional regulator [Candidatus Omnitrophota bacterium]
MQSIYSAEYRAFLQRLKAQRLLRRRTQVEVANALGKPQSFVSKIERGERRLDPLELKQLAALYGVSADWLLGKRAK